MKHNIELVYMYRDGGNYKNYGSVVFSNDSLLSLAGLEIEICNHLDMGEFFIADQVGIPEVFSWDPEADYDPDDPETYPDTFGPGGYVIQDIDHCWHEFIGLSVTDNKPTDERSISEFIADLEREARKGWNLFLPDDRRVAV